MRKQCQTRIEKLDRAISQWQLGLNELKEEMLQCGKELKNGSNNFFPSFICHALENETRICHNNVLKKHWAEMLQLEKDRFEQANKLVSTFET